MASILIKLIKISQLRQEILIKQETISIGIQEINKIIIKEMKGKSLNSYKSEDNLYRDKYLSHPEIQIKQLGYFEPKDKRRKQKQLNQNHYLNRKHQGAIHKYQWRKQSKEITNQQEPRHQWTQQSHRYQYRQQSQQRQQYKQHQQAYQFNNQLRYQQERYQHRQQQERQECKQSEGRDGRQEYGGRSQHIDLLEYEQQQYREYLEGLSVEELERELGMMREKERGYYKLNHQLKVLQRKSKLLDEETKGRQFTLTAKPEDEQIASIKSEIQGVISSIRTIGDETKLIKRQIVGSKQQLNILQTQLDKLKQQNFNIQSNINQQTQKLFTQKKTIQHVETEQLQKLSQIQSIRNQIKLLQKQAIILEKELSILQQEKQARSNKKNQLNNLVFQLHQNLLIQSQHQNQLKLKLKNAHQLKHQLQQQLKLLRLKQTQLISFSQTKNQEYHKLLEITQQSQREIINIKDQLFIVQSDINQLNSQFIQQTDLLKQEETQNQLINNQFDALTQQATQLWNSVTQLIQIQTSKHQPNQLQNKQLFNSLHNITPQNHNSLQQLKFKALKLWNEIQQLIQTNQHS